MNWTRKISALTLAAVLTAAAAYAAGKPPATTLDNLRDAFVVEAVAKARYAAYAAKAAEEGYAGIAVLFRAVAMSEGIHGANHAASIISLGGSPAAEVKPPLVKTTRDNLTVAVRTEKNESGNIYPAYVKQAIAESNPQVVMSLKGAMASEGGHARLFSKALKKMEDWKNAAVILVCRTCGYTSDDLELKFCPFCTHPRKEFAEVN